MCFIYVINYDMSLKTKIKRYNRLSQGRILTHSNMSLFSRVCDYFCHAIEYHGNHHKVIQVIDKKPYNRCFCYTHGTNIIPANPTHSCDLNVILIVCNCFFLPKSCNLLVIQKILRQRGTMCFHFVLEYLWSTINQYFIFSMLLW